MSKIIVIVGPTATYKTKISIELAKLLDAVIINADSTQVYKEPLIATAKIRENEKEGIPHYLFDIVSLSEDYTLFDYQKDARRLLDKFIKENKNVIIVGGSGLYIKALLYNYELKDDEVIIDAYLKYPFRDDIIYGLGYYIAFHLNEIRNKDIKDFNRIFNDIITLRKEANLEDLINLLGISKDEFTSCKLIEDRMKEDILSLNKKFNVY